MRIEPTRVSSPSANSWSINGLATFIVKNEDGSNIFCHASKPWIALFKHSLIRTYFLFFDPYHGILIITIFVSLLNPFELRDCRLQFAHQHPENPILYILMFLVQYTPNLLKGV